MIKKFIREQKMTTGFLLLSSLAVLISFYGCGDGDGTSTPTPTGPAEVVTACCSNGIPSGYYKINDDWSPTTCGSPSSITYNVCTYQRYDNKSIGAVMTICAGQPLASGWLQTNSDWNPTSCGHPSSITNNIWTVKKNS